MTDESLALVGGTTYVSPTEEPLRDGVVLIHDGEIAAVGSRALVQIPQSAKTLDCAGLTITAGFWNSHVHFFERKWANAASIPPPELRRQLEDTITRYGFTSVFDLGSAWVNTMQIRDRIESGEVSGPRIRSTGEGLVPTGGVPSEQILNVMGVMKMALPEIANASQSGSVTKKLLYQGVDGIKLFASSQAMTLLPEGAIQAAVNETHRFGKPVFVHPNSGADVLAAVRGGVDVIAHTTPRSGAWDETILGSMMESRVALIPTLTLWKYYLRHDRISAQEQVVRTAIAQLRAWLACEGSVLFGTDLGAVDPDPSEEYELMAEAGMSFSQILASLTTEPAKRFGESKRLGRIAAGFQADLVVSKDSLSAVKYTLRAGKIIYRSKTE